MKERKNSKTQQTKDSSSSDLVSNIHQLTEQATNKYLASPEYLKQLEENNVGLQQMINTLNTQLTQKTQEVQHLMELLAGMTPVVGEVNKLMPSDEEVIADLQLKSLKASALVRDLTLDEVKRMDLLVKNKRLAQGAATTIDGQAKKLLPNTDRSTLIQIASHKLKED